MPMASEVLDIHALHAASGRRVNGLSETRTRRQRRSGIASGAQSRQFRRSRAGAFSRVVGCIGPIRGFPRVAGLGLAWTVNPGLQKIKNKEGPLPKFKINKPCRPNSQRSKSRCRRRRAELWLCTRTVATLSVCAPLLQETTVLHVWGLCVKS
jgi:hypothetical protein